MMITFDDQKEPLTMRKPSRSMLVLAISLASFALALYFGLTAHTMQNNYNGDIMSINDWGKVALTLVFGLVGGLGLATLLRKSS